MPKQPGFLIKNRQKNPPRRSCSRGQGHLGEYHLGGARLRGFFDYCIEHEIDGFELLHPHNTPKTVSRILDFAERFRRETGRILLLTAGSDYHGKNKAVLPAMPWML